jgi:predicted DNA-binding transcriptional regulator AlpA
MEWVASNFIGRKAVLKLPKDPPQEPCTSVVDVLKPTNPVPALEGSIVLAGFLRRDELARQLGLSPRTIDRWEALREGPPRVHVGRTILYNVESVREWLRSREQQSSSVNTGHSFPRKTKQEQLTTNAACKLKRPTF